jgi:S1-C subfamily serine protease
MKQIAAAAALLLAILTGAGTTQAQPKGTGNDEKGNSSHGWLGVSIQDVTPRLARERDFHVKSGALVNGVTSESPADEAGIKEDDVIVEFNGKSIDDADDLLEAVRGAAPGDHAGVTFYRGAEKKTLQVTLDRAPRRSFSFHGPGGFMMPHIPPMPHMARRPRVRIFREEGIEGLELTDLNKQLGEYFGAPNGRGVLVEKVERESAGEKGGFKAGDVIIKAGKEDVETTEDIAEALEGITKGEKIEFGVLRKETHLTLTVESEGERERGDRMYNFNGEFREDLHNGLYDDARMREGQSVLKREMERVKDELRSFGNRIRTEVQDLGRTLRSVAS